MLVVFAVWGVLGLAWIKGIYPVLSRTIDAIPKDVTKYICIAFTVFFVFDCIVSASAAVRMDKRQENVPARNKVEIFLDEHYTDERMHAIYANSKDV